MSKTVKQALIDEIVYPLPEGLVDNKIVTRQLDGTANFTYDVSQTNSFKGAFADCLVALVQSVGFSEADKSVSPISDEVKKKLLIRANNIYKAIGEEEVTTEAEPVVYINC